MVFRLRAGRCMAGCAAVGWGPRAGIPLQVCGRPLCPANRPRWGTGEAVPDRVCLLLRRVRRSASSGRTCCRSFPSPPQSPPAHAPSSQPHPMPGPLTPPPPLSTPKLHGQTGMLWNTEGGSPMVPIGEQDLPTPILVSDGASAWGREHSYACGRAPPLRAPHLLHARQR